MKLPRWAELGRQGWKHTGAERPAFAETPGPGRESVWDYPRPPRLVGDDRRIQVQVADIIIADTVDAARVLETSHPPTFYLPRKDVRMEYLEPVGRGSRCEWKGEASYFDVVVADRRFARAAWSYEAPFGEFEPVAGHICFYASELTCVVDGHRAKPQPGGFYGGWITPELVGPFKGEPGSGGW